MMCCRDHASRTSLGQSAAVAVLPSPPAYSGHSPNGSVNVTASPPANPYRFKPPASPIGSSCVKERTVAGFGKQLAEIRKRHGLTQQELGQAVGVSQRVIAYYERAHAQPPGAMLAHLAQALRVSMEELLGAKPVSDKTRPKTARLLKRLGRIEELPAADQRAVLKMVDALLTARRRTGNR